MEANLICTMESSSLKNWECELSLEEEKYINEKACLKCFSGSLLVLYATGWTPHPYPAWQDTGNILSREERKFLDPGYRGNGVWGWGVGLGDCLLSDEWRASTLFSFVSQSTGSQTFPFRQETGRLLFEESTSQG